MFRFLPLLSLLIASLGALAQPSNDDCANAIAIAVGTECTPQTYTCIGATGEALSVAPNPTCGIYQGGDVWFSFTVPASGDFRIEVTSTFNAAQWALFSGSCGSFTQETCASNGNQLFQNFGRDDLAGQTVYIRVWRFNSAAGTDFTLCVREIDRPTNDDCANAVALQVGTSCTPESFTTEFATTEGTGVVGNPSCSVFAGNDIWFSIDVPASGNFRIEASGTGVQWELYSGSCGNLSVEACATGNAQLNQNFIRPDLANTTLLLRAWRFNSTAGVDFSFCVQEFTPLPNDDCANATELAVSLACTPESFTTEFATSEPVTTAPNPSCSVYQGNDVWFRFDTPASGNFRVEMTTAGLNGQWELYSGSCGNFTSVACATSNNQLAQNFANPALGGQTLYLRVWRFNSTAAVNFDLCVIDITPPENDNCAAATAIAVALDCTYTSFSGQLSTEEPGIAPDPSCGLYLGGDVWFTFTAPASGQFAVDVQHLSGPNTHFAVYQGSCGALSEIECSAAGQANFNDPALGSQTFLVRAWAFNSIQGSTFELCIVNTTVAANDNCADAIALAVNPQACAFETFTNLGATNETEIAPAPGCGVYQGGDVWFTVDASAENFPFTIELQSADGNIYQLAAYTGSCGNFTETACIPNSESIVFNNPDLIGQTLYLRVWRLNNEEGGDFNLCAAKVNCQADFNEDGIINIIDLSAFLGNFGCTGTCPSDLDSDGSVSSNDLMIFLSVLGVVCEP